MPNTRDQTCIGVRLNIPPLRGLVAGDAGTIDIPPQRGGGQAARAASPRPLRAGTPRERGSEVRSQTR
jgi:hypothetical protein